jgi:hypothetical protein
VRAAWRIIDQKTADERANDEQPASPIDAALRRAPSKDVPSSAKEQVPNPTLTLTLTLSLTLTSAVEDA